MLKNSTVTWARSFSHMKKIESVLRSFVAHERMYNLALLNTELIVHKMDFTDIIDLFTAAKTRKRLSITAIRYLPIFPRPPSLLYSVHRTQRRGWLLGLDLVTMSVIDLRDRHWLPVQHRITYKICLLVHLVHNNRAPFYLVDSVTATASLSPWTTSDRKQPTVRAAENTTQIWRALLRLCWSGSLEQPSIISSRTNRYYSF